MILISHDIYPGNILPTVVTVDGDSAINIINNFQGNAVGASIYAYYAAAAGKHTIITHRTFLYCDYASAYYVVGSNASGIADSLWMRHWG